MSLRRMVAVVALASAVPVRVAAARVRLNAMTARTSQAALAVNFRGQVRQGGVLQVGVDLFDDGVPRWVLSAATVSRLVGGGEEGVEPPSVEQGLAVLARLG